MAIQLIGEVKMRAYRAIIKQKNHKIIVKLPDGFNNEEYEVILLPVIHSEEKNLKPDFLLNKYRNKIIIDKKFDEPLYKFKEYI